MDVNRKDFSAVSRFKKTTALRCVCLPILATNPYYYNNILKSNNIERDDKNRTPNKITHENRKTELKRLLCSVSCFKFNGMSTGQENQQLEKQLTTKAYLPTLPVFPESPSLSSNFPVSRLEHQISREIPTVAFFKKFSCTSLFSRC